VEDLRGGSRRIRVDRAHGRPRPAFPELVDEAEPFHVGKEEEISHELRRLVDDGTARTGGDQALGHREIGQAADVGGLGLEHEIEGQGHRLALDEGLAREEAIAVTGFGGDEGVDGQLAVLQGVHQLVHEGGALLLPGQPVAHHHDLAEWIVVGGDLLLEQIEKETLEIVVRGQHPPRDHALALRLELVLGVAPVDLLLDEAPIVRARAHEDGRGRPWGGDAPELGELIVERRGHRGERGLLLRVGP
jgi:hypothetical protein